MTSYYGRPVLKAPVWEWKIPAYLFTGGLSAGSALLGAGADLTGRPALRRAGRLTALASLGAGTGFLISDLGRPARFHHMLRVAKPTSPMSVGSWLLAAYAPGAGLAALSELRRPGPVPGWCRPRPARGPRPPRPRLSGPRTARAAGLWSALVAPAVASYTAVLLSQTAVPAWHEAHPQLPFVFAGSTAASAGGAGMVFAPVAEAGPARTFGAIGGVLDIASSRLLEYRLGPAGEAYRTGQPRRLLRWAEGLTAAGIAGTVLARRSRIAAAVSGLTLLAGSALQRFGTYQAGVESTKDPKYVVEPQRQRRNARSAAAAGTVSGA